jgi:hypothetical protein
MAKRFFRPANFGYGYFNEWERPVKTIIGISNFSLDKSHFFNFAELESSLMALQNIKSSFNQAKLGFLVGNDIAHNSGFGNSLYSQIKNFEFGGDIGIQTSFQIKLHQKYLKGFDLSLTTDELESKSLEDVNVAEGINYIIYTPSLLVLKSKHFKNQTDFSLYYEKILGEYPTDNRSYYERAISHFTNLIYHPECFDTLSRVTDGFIHYSEAFVICLKALNKFSPTIIVDTNDKIRAINSATPYDCTSEGNSHPNFKFEFTHKNKKIVALNCEYHLKPSGNNNIGDGSFHHKRLYFGFIPIENNQWRVAIAAMGPHINTNSTNDRYQSQKR